ncbi:hypothetical protein AAFF_G00138200 [Aldrovandia affinis]|uniref:BLOC-2 complex member HPS6 C-terminal domain-containing protein n=1 Tax=Aldrovandia affinis TaxID=143900 RepID=A0AAD7TBW4_9TELE|nr:hypothetical protein AAFF_G00138200 [Aldrovandia affinis]
MPLYKRALSVLPENGEVRDLEVELLLCSQRPNAVMQALRILIGQQQWGWVTQVAERFCRQSPLLNKEIFTTLLCEVSQHRDLDPYLDLLWALCPEDLTVTSILNMVLKDLPTSPQGAAPFPAQGGQLTIGLLKPLLSKVLLRETKPSQRYADILQSPSFPPPTPPPGQRAAPRGDPPSHGPPGAQAEDCLWDKSDVTVPSLINKPPPPRAFPAAWRHWLTGRVVSVSLGISLCSAWAGRSLLSIERGKRRSCFAMKRRTFQS